MCSSCKHNTTRPTLPKTRPTMATLPVPIPTTSPAISFPKCPSTITTMPRALLPSPIPPTHPLPSKTPSVFQSIFTKPQHLRNSRRSEAEEDDTANTLVEPLRVPEQWLHPSQALLESEWLRVTLHKWLDDEYCPEPTNIEISKVAAQSYYESLVGNHADLGEILLKMARDLESISYKESFHGAFSSANAAVSLIAQRVASIEK